jgi:hypothetical protein
MKPLIKKTIIIPYKYKTNKIYHTSINYNDSIYIDYSNQSTIYHFLHSKNLSSTNLSEINN